MDWRITRSGQMATYRPSKAEALKDAKEMARQAGPSETVAVWERDSSGTQRCLWSAKDGKVNDMTRGRK